MLEILYCEVVFVELIMNKIKFLNILNKYKNLGREIANASDLLFSTK